MQGHFCLRLFFKKILCGVQCNTIFHVGPYSQNRQCSNLTGTAVHLLLLPTQCLHSNPGHQSKWHHGSRAWCTCWDSSPGLVAHQWRNLFSSFCGSGLSNHESSDHWNSRSKILIAVAFFLWCQWGLYSWIGQGLQIGPTLAFSLWLPDFKTKTSFGFLIKKSGVVCFYFVEKSKKRARTAKNSVLAILAKIWLFSDNSNM